MGYYTYLVYVHLYFHVAALHVLSKVLMTPLIDTSYKVVAVSFQAISCIYITIYKLPNNNLLVTVTLNVWLPYWLYN